MNQGELLLQLRSARGISQRDLANAARVSLTTAARDEAGSQEMHSGTAVRLLKTLAQRTPFNTDECAEIQEAFGLNPSMFAKAGSAPEQPANFSPAALATALTGIVGESRATQLLRQLLVDEATALKTSDSTRALAHTSEHAGTDGKTYRVTTVTPINPKATAKAAVRKKSHGA